jgi:hypothetical protein
LSSNAGSTSPDATVSVRERLREERVEAVVGAGEQMTVGRERGRDARVAQFRRDLERVRALVDQP